uniref:Uncharacterized protein n=2 Tax=viral metagenome TaxID=1070528 RepID=A0A6M3JVW2_9ZZZZ
MKSPTEIEKYFDSPENMHELINYLQDEYFNSIDIQASLFRGGDLSDIVQLRKTLDELTGIYMDLNVYYKISETIKKNREIGHFISKKIEIENKGEKFTSTPIEKEASNVVANERKIRNIILGKLESCMQGISSAQSDLKNATMEGVNR